MKRIIIIAVSTLLACVAVFFVATRLIETWPKYEIKPEYKAIVDAKVKNYNERHYTYQEALAPYTAFGDYLNMGKWQRFAAGKITQFDSNGIIMVKYGEKFYYNPVTIAQYAFSKYGQYLAGQAEKQAFLTIADFLITLQGTDGAFRYSFPYKYYLTKEAYQPGWVSSMAQGQAMSVFARAYHLTGDHKYLDAGNKALKFLLTPIKQGGVRDTLKDLHPSLQKYVFFEEYISSPSTYTLNGYMFTMLGLYDWSQIPDADAKTAGLYFTKAVTTLKKILKYYDIGGITTYDLGHLTYDKVPHVNVSYHAVHIFLLHAFYTITNESIFKEYEDRWSSYVQA